MNIFDIQSLIAKRKIVTIQDIDPDNAYLQLGVYQPNNRKKGSGENTYPSYAISLTDLGLGGCSDVTAAEIYDLSVNGQLKPCKKYRITDYRSVNWLHGSYEAQYGSPSSGITFLSGTVVNPLTYNIVDQNGFIGGLSIPYIGDFSLQSDGSMILGGEFCVGLTPGAPPPDPFTTDPAYAVRINRSGIKDPNFTYINSSVCSFAFGTYAVGTTSVFPDDSFLIGGVLSNTPSLRKYIFSGGVYTIDLAFNPVFGPSSPSAIVKATEIQADGKILVGGYFNTLNGTTLNHFARLNPDGTPDIAFNANLGTGFDNQVMSIAIQADGKILVAGSFNTFKGNPRTYLVRLNADGTEDTAFYSNLGTGFDSVIYSVKVQPDGKILVGGDFGDLNGNTRANLVRLNANGTEDVAFYTNLGTSFNGAVYTVLVHSDGSIFAGGQFSSFDGNTCAGIVKLSSAGVENATFTTNAGIGFDNTCYIIKELPNGNIGAGGLFGAYGASFTFRFCEIANDDYEYPYDNQSVHIGEPETIIVTASTNYDFEPIAYSEKYPQDILNFLPFVNKLGIYWDYSNGDTLPNGNTISGFDLLWNGKNVYFQMPEGSPVLFGHSLYIFAQSTRPGFNNNMIDFIAEPARPGISQANYGYAGYYNENPSIVDPDYVNTRIQISPDGMTVVLLDWTYNDYLKYATDSLYVSNATAIVPAYGWVTRRHDTTTNINVPFDYKNFKYRRYEALEKTTTINSDLVLNEPYVNYLPSTSYALGILTTTGNYMDYYSIDPEKDCQHIYIDGVGGPWTSWYNGMFDNTVFVEYATLVNIKVYNVFMNNTFYDQVRNINFNTIQAVQNNLFGGYMYTVSFEGIGNSFTYLNYNTFVAIGSSVITDTSNSTFGNINFLKSRYPFPNSTNYTVSTYFNTFYNKDIIYGSNSQLYIQYFDGTNLQFVTPITS